MPCSVCGDALPPAARFCSSCGAPHESPAAPRGTESRKVVTVLFCDLVGSTALSGGLDPETLRSVTLRYFELMRRQIEFHGGTVEKFIGDAVMAVFGVPAVHEDDARRALAAALGMLAALDGLNTELDATLGVRLDVRIGVNTGQVVSGSDASARQALVSGETVNVAARLEQNAGAGQILIGPDTLRSAGAAVRSEPVGPLSLKGKAEPVRAYRLLGLGEDDPELLRRFDVPFIGRRSELAALDAALALAAGGYGALRVLVHGEAGQGKTRLLREWLETRTVRCGVGRCRQYGDHGSLSPLADAVASLLTAERGVAQGDAEGDAERDAEALRILAGGLLLDGTPNPTVEDTCAALVRVLGTLCARRPVVLVIDDCHWSGALLLDVLDRLTRDLDRAAVLVVCLSRPELLDTRPGMAEPPARVVPLRGLPYDESVLLAAGLTDVGAHWDSTPARLLERANGNPLHLEQLLAAAAETGSQDELPPTVQALLGARIDALDPPERAALDLASVIGREFAPGELAGLCGTRDGVGPALARLSRRRLVEPGPRGAFRFSSGLVQEVTYQSMAKRARAEGHEKAAALPSVLGAGQAAVGGHLERAYGYRTDLGQGDAATEALRLRAADALGRAGAQALARSDLPWAEDLLARSVALRGPGEPDGTAATRRLGQVRSALGRGDEGRALLLRALTAADPVESAHARLALAALGHDGESPVEAAEAVLPVFEAAHDELGQAQACLRLAQRCQSRGRHREADRRLTRALAHAVAADQEPERAAALGAIGISLWRGPEPVPAAVARCRALLAEHGPGRRTVRMTLNCPLAVLHALDDQWTSARECLAQAGRLAEELGYAETEVVLPLFTAMVEALADHGDRALGLLDRAARRARRLGAATLLDSIGLETARLLTDRGAWPAAADVLGRLGWDSGRSRAEAAEFDGLSGRLAAARGRPDEALRLAARAVDAAGRTDSPVVRALAALDQAHTFRLLGRDDRAAARAADARAVFAAKGHRPGVRWAERAAHEPPPHDLLPHDLLPQERNEHG
ncbi:adenylate/guanylate cyclase domain-containing protein [Streptomyces sp. NPDC006739]|uniref:adenylate/guanylate cyclase domain-containing protein n=1 Tax=Streptomyces sp. NPDC006739 TaxID=3364763 RepID=UPI003675E6BE